MCWVALDRASRLAAIRGDSKLEYEWAATADEIKEEILEHGLRDGVLRRHDNRFAGCVDPACGALRLSAPG